MHESLISTFINIHDGARRGPGYKLFKKRHGLDVRKYKFANTVCEKWNRLEMGLSLKAQ